MSTIHVSLDTSANPPVTCSPNPQHMNRGNDPINWKPAAKQSFTFYSLTGLPSPPFSTPVVSDSEITVTDNNQGTQDYPYTIVVTLDGIQYSSSTASKTAMGGSGDPTIKNN